MIQQVNAGINEYLIRISCAEEQSHSESGGKTTFPTLELIYLECRFLI
jgi:hypothetical protein